MDVHVPASITRMLRRLGVDVLTAQEDGAARLADKDLLDRAGTAGRLMFTMDSDFLAEAVWRQRRGGSFATVVYVHPMAASIGRCVQDLALLAEATDEAEKRGQIVYLPL